MSLIKALVADGSTILAEHQLEDPKRPTIDFTNVVHTILSNPSNEIKLSYSLENYLIHRIIDEHFTYMVVALTDSIQKPPPSLKNLPFAFLTDLQNQFNEFHPASSSSTLQSPISISTSTPSPSPSSYDSFSPTIATLLHKYNTNPPTDQFALAHAEIDQVKAILIQNVEQIMNRGDRIALLVDKTDIIANQATDFRRVAKSVRRQMWWKNGKILVLCVLVAVFFLYLAVAQFCGAALHCIA